MDNLLSIPKSHTTNVNKVNGGEIFVYRAPVCKGCRGMAMGSTVFKRINPKSVQEQEVFGVRIQPVTYDSNFITVSGQRIENFKSVTIKISKAP